MWYCMWVKKVSLKMMALGADAIKKQDMWLILGLLSSEGRIPEIPPRILARWWALVRPETWPLILSTNKYFVKSYVRIFMARHWCSYFSLSFPTSKALPSTSSSASPWSCVGSGLLPAGAAHLWLQFCLGPLHSGAGEEVKSRLHILPIVRRGRQEHYAHTTLLHQERLGAPVVVVLRGNRPGNLGLGPELPALSTTYPASLYKCWSCCWTWTTKTWGPYPPFWRKEENL